MKQEVTDKYRNTTPTSVDTVKCGKNLASKQLLVQVYCSRVNSFSRLQLKWSDLFSKTFLGDFGQCIRRHLNAQTSNFLQSG